MSQIVETRIFTTDTALLVGGEYTVDEDVYLSSTTMLITNNVANQIADIGSIGKIVEAPVVTETNDRMVLRLTVTDELMRPIKDVLRSNDL